MTLESKPSHEKPSPRKNNHFTIDQHLSKKVIGNDASKPSSNNHRDQNLTKNPTYIILPLLKLSTRLTSSRKS